MKLRSTTPLSSFFYVLRMSTAVGLAVATITIGVVQTSNATDNTANQVRINQLTDQIDQQVSAVQKLGGQSSSIQKQISRLETEREYLKQQIADSSKSQQDLTSRLAATKIKLHNQQLALGSIMASAYVDNRISPLEMLASSASIGDFLDKQIYQASAVTQLASSIDQVKHIKSQLVAERTELQRLVASQTYQQQALADRSSKSNGSLAVVQGQVLELSKLTTAMKQEKEALQQQQQRSIFQALSGAQQVSSGTVSEPVIAAVPVKKPAPKPVAPVVATPKPTTPAKTPAITPVQPIKPVVSQPPASTPTPPAPVVPKPAPVPVVLPNGGYPSYLNNCYVDAYALSYGIDPWGYGCRQCVSYTAWKVLQKTGKTAAYWGNANMWPTSAKRAGYKVSAQPRAGSVGVMLSGPYGHVVWVESINSNGTLNISQYNYWLPNKPNGGWGYYSEFKNVSPNAYQAYIYI